ncbi:MAG: DUF1178 family protein [Brachymonas sp.]|nr:DUF1178 family protein [Brachymonas sp.]
MKVLDLQCAQSHGFEGWFGSEEDFQSQLARGLVQCPICDSAQITKKLSAPRLNLKSVREASTEDATQSIALRADSMPANGQNGLKNAPLNSPEHPMQALMRNPEFQAAYMHMAKEVLAKTEDVGTQFASEARKIHYGEEPERGIRGQVSRDEALELLDEGIDVMPLPLPAALKGPLQ